MENDQTPDPYDAVLADLRAKKEQIDATIALLESLRATGVPTLPGATSLSGGLAQKPSGPVPSLGPGAFLGMSIPDAAKKLLVTQRRQMTTAEIAKEIERGGVVLTSADKVNTVGSVLLRRFYNTGDIVRVSRGIWGLAVWYPGRKFQKGSKSEENGSKDSGETQEESTSVGNESDTNPDFQHDKPIDYSFNMND